jgi:hypothetical protein
MYPKPIPQTPAPTLTPEELRKMGEASAKASARARAERGEK